MTLILQKFSNSLCVARSVKLIDKNRLNSGIMAGKGTSL
jgi:hypothetical protein